MSDEPICRRCGEPVVGYALIKGKRYCHPPGEYPTRPDCYSLTQWDLAEWTRKN